MTPAPTPNASADLVARLNERADNSKDMHRIGVDIYDGIYREAALALSQQV
jgi:hypothetical protein